MNLIELLSRVLMIGIATRSSRHPVPRAVPWLPKGEPPQEDLDDPQERLVKVVG